MLIMRTPFSQAVTYLLDGKQASKQASTIVFPFFFFFPPEQEKMHFSKRKYLPPFLKEKLCLRTCPPDTIEFFLPVLYRIILP
jgi:hypothetical protein